MGARWMVLVATGALLAGCGPGPGDSTGPSTPATGGASASATGMTCPAGSTPDQPGDPDGARPALPDPYQLAAMDPSSPRIIVGETGFVPEGAGSASLQSTWAFDLCSNAWTELGDASLPEPQQRPALVQLVTDADAGVVRGIPVWWSPVWAFDPTSDSWSASAAGRGEREAVPVAVYDTDGDRVLAFDPNARAADAGASGVLAYDPASGTWTGIELADPGQEAPAVTPSDSVDMAYDSAAHQVILVLTPTGSGTAARTWRFDPAAQSWARGTDLPDTGDPGSRSRGWAAAFDPQTARTWWFSDSAMLGYDAGADAWQAATRDAGWPEPMRLGAVPVDPTARIVSTMVADPVNGRLVVIAGSVRPAGDPAGGATHQGDLLATDDVWAYQPAANTWTMLLAPSSSPASYGPG